MEWGGAVIVVGIFEISRERCKSIKQFINKSKSPGSAWQHGWVFENLSSEWIPICSGSGLHPSVHCLPFSIHIHGHWGQRYLTHSRCTQQNFHMVRGNGDAVGPPLLPTPQPSIPFAAALFVCLHTSGRLGGGQKR